jgi:hypothetical protein
LIRICKEFIAGLFNLRGAIPLGVKILVGVILELVEQRYKQFLGE